MNALTTDTAAVLSFALGGLVDLIDKDNAGLFGGVNGAPRHFLFIQQLVCLAIDQDVMTLGNGHFALFGARAHRPLEHIADIEHRPSAAGHIELTKGRLCFGHVDLYFIVIQLARDQFLTKPFARGVAGIGASEDVDHFLLGLLFCAGADIFAHGLAGDEDRVFGQIPDDLFDIAADIAHFGEFRRLNFDKGRLGQCRKAARDFRFSNPCGANHEDIFRIDLFLHLGRQLLAAPPVAHGHGHGAFGIGLTDDIAIKLGDDFPRSEFFHHRILLVQNFHSGVAICEHANPRRD